MDAADRIRSIVDSSGGSARPKAKPGSGSANMPSGTDARARRETVNRSWAAPNPLPLLHVLYTTPGGIERALYLSTRYTVLHGRAGRRRRHGYALYVATLMLSAVRSGHARLDGDRCAQPSMAAPSVAGEKRSAGPGPKPPRVTCRASVGCSFVQRSQRHPARGSGEPGSERRGTPMRRPPESRGLTAQKLQTWRSSMPMPGESEA